MLIAMLNAKSAEDQVGCQPITCVGFETDIQLCSAWLQLLRSTVLCLRCIKHLLLRKWYHLIF